VQPGKDDRFDLSWCRNRYEWDRHVWGEKLDTDVDEKSRSVSAPTRGNANPCPDDEGE
jgi:hypothetical protein